MNSKPIDDIITAFLITYALAVFSFEKYVPDGVMKLMQIIVFAAFAVSWLGFSFKNGKRKGVAFPIFAVIFWLFPQLIIYLSNNGPEIFRMSITMYVLSEFSNLLTTTPMEITGNIVGISAYGAAAVILLVCAACYLFGMLLEEE